MKKIILFAVLSTTALCAFAAPQTFDFKDPKGVNNVTFKTDAPLESISGSASGISGTVDFDSADPAATKGKIVVAAESLHVPNPMMQGHLHGEQWLDVKKFPEITFESLSLENAKTEGTTTSADLTGNMTIHGVTKKISVPVKLTYLKDKLKDRLPNMKGDLLVIRARFTIKRLDYGINPGAPTDKVSDDIELNLSVAGQCPAK